MLKPSPDIYWVVETCGVTIASPHKNVHVSIPYPHAALWTAIAGESYIFERARDMMAVLMATESESAGREIQQTLEDWHKQGLIVTE